MANEFLRRALGDRRVLCAVTFCACFLAFLGPLLAYDLWWHMEMGRLILSLRAVPKTDPFSFTAAGRAWVDHSWLAGLLLLGLWKVGGAAGLILFRSAVITGSLALAWVAARRRGVGAAVASVIVLAACLQLKVRALERPYLLSYAFFMIFLLVLRATVSRPGARGGRRWLAAEDSFLWGAGGRLLALPVLTVLWANLHAGFVAGMLAIGAFGVGEVVALAARRGDGPLGRALLKSEGGARFRAMFVSGVLCLAASVVTPYGPGALLYPILLLGQVKLVKKIQEWQPTPLRADFLVFWAVVLVGAIILVRSAWFAFRTRRLRDEAGGLVTDVLLMGGFSILALHAVRHMEWVLLLAPSVLGYHLDVSRFFRDEEAAPGKAVADGAPSGPTGCGAPATAAARRVGERPVYSVAVWLLALVVGVWPYVTGGLPRFEPARGRFPIEACDFLQKEGLRYRMYNAYEWGGYLIWRLWPQERVFIDGRCDVYGDRIIGPALAVQDATPGWEGVFRDWDVEMFLVNYRRKDAKHLFTGRPWQCIYWDDAAVIGLRDDVLQARPAALRTFPLTNPVFADRPLDQAKLGDMLAELDVVLERDPQCWTALALRARCLVALAGQDSGRRGELLAAALDAARAAVALQPRRHEPWEALAEAAGATGDADLATTAAKKAERLRPKKESGD